MAFNASQMPDLSMTGAGGYIPGPNTFDPTWRPYGDMPASPGYGRAYDPSTMSIADYLNSKYDPSALNQFKQEAMRKGPSAWATLARSQQNALQSNARERGASEIHGQTAQAEDELASRGGLSSGARERTALEGSKNYLAMSQDLSRQGNLNDLQIGVNDEQNRIQQLGMVPGMEMGEAGMLTDARKADVAATTAENARRNDYNQEIYGKQLGAWGANRQAQATEKSGKK